MKRVFVLIPVADDLVRLDRLLREVNDVLASRGDDYQVVVVDDRGAADAADWLARLRQQMPVEAVTHRFPRGRRETLRDGIERIADACAADDAIVVMASDGAPHLATLPVMLATLEAGADVVVASRVRRTARGVHVPWIRRVLARLLLPRLFGLSGVRDFDSGFYVVRGRMLQAALRRYGGRLIEPSPWEFVSPLEVLCKLARTGAVCTEVPVVRGAESGATEEQPARPGMGDFVDGHVDLLRRLWALDEAAHAAGRPEGRRVLPFRRWEWWALAAILLAALAVRLYAITRIPSVVIHDECDNLVNVYQILNGRGPGFFGFDWKPQPAASVYVLSLAMRMGMSVFTLRLPAVLYSVGALIPFFLLARRVLAPPVALLATLLLATDIWYLHFSRSGWENIGTCLILAAAAVCIRDALRSGRLRAFVWAGVWSALGGYAYFSGRAVFPAVLLAGVLSMLRPWIPRWRLLVGLLVTTLTAAVLFAPQMPAIVADWDVFQRRSREVNILGGENAHKTFSQKARILTGSFTRKANELFVDRRTTTDRYLRVDAGPLAAPTTMLLAAGLLLSVFWAAETWLWWVFLLVPYTLTEVMTAGFLNGARGVIFVPVLYLFVGLALHALWRFTTLLFRPLAAAIVVGAIALSISTTQQYFEWIQAPKTVEDLEPAIPVAEFDEWQAYVLDWTAKTDDFFNLYMWEDHRRQRALGALQNPAVP